MTFLTNNNFFIYNIILFLQSILLLLTCFLGLIKNKNNILLIFIFLEIGLLAISLTFVFGLNLIIIINYYSQIIAIFIMALAAMESCIGLCLLIVFFKLKNSISTKKLNSLIN